MPQPDLRCYHHPDREATSQCESCGDYLCEECVTYFREQYLCARCAKDLAPKEKIGKNGQIACVINALACSFWIMVAFKIEGYESITTIALLFVSMMFSVVAVIMALSHIRGQPSGDVLFRWSVVIVAVWAGVSALFIAGLLCILYIPDRGFIATSRVATIFGSIFGVMFLGNVCSVLTSTVLLGAAGLRHVRPRWPLAVALLASLMFAVCLTITASRL